MGGGLDCLRSVGALYRLMNNSRKTTLEIYSGLLSCVNRGPIPP